MKSDRDIRQEKKSLESLQVLAEAYAEISARRMKQTREAVLNTRDFLGAIRDIFEDVRYSYRRQVRALGKKRRAGGRERITFLGHNGKTVAAWLSANTGLYGQIVRDTFKVFVDEIKRTQAEATVIGKMGQSMWLESGVTVPYTFFDLPDYGQDPGKLAAILRHLVQYERVLVFYGKFKSVVRQEPEKFEVSAESLMTQAVGEHKRLKYYFEPTLEEILQFFEAEMFASLVDQTVRESELAKFASRMLAMDKAGENIRQELVRVGLWQLRLRHLNENRKQLQLLAGMGLW